MSVAMSRLQQKVKCILEQLCLAAQIRPYWWTPDNTETPQCTKGLEVLPSLCSVCYSETGWTTDTLSYNSCLATWRFPFKQFGDRTVRVICCSQKVVLQDVGWWKWFLPEQLNKCSCQLCLEHAATLSKYQHFALNLSNYPQERCFESSASACIANSVVRYVTRGYN